MAAVVKRVFPTPMRRPAFVSRGQRVRFHVLLMTVVVLSACTFARGRGYFGAIKRLVFGTPSNIALPSMAMTYPPDGAVGMPPDMELTAEFKSARGGIDPASAEDANVVLVRTGDQ